MEIYVQIVESFINGQIKQGKKQLKKLTLDQRVDFVELSEEFKMLDSTDKSIILECLITRKF